MTDSMNRLVNFLSSPSRVLIIIILSLLLLTCTKYSSKSQLELSPEIVELVSGQCKEDCVENPVLIDHIETVLAKPSGKSPVLNNPEQVKNQKDQPRQVDSILKYFNNKTQLGWTGLLVEPNNGIYDLLVSKKRNAFSINSCLSVKGYAEKVKFDTADVFGAIESDESDDAKQRGSENQKKFLHKEVIRETVTVQCFPLYSILLAIGNPKVDFMSLDVEGSELGVLKTIPFDKVDIELFLIETVFQNMTEVNALMSEAGYENIPIPHDHDSLYAKKLVK
eukprot:GFUD01074116.1.p1 GENE.GFUD01074116.1~~GFUD01074116.1.p1  ORF type:complete len:279 (+),score=83.55 GFUD01074116.1:40-876(+)